MSTDDVTGKRAWTHGTPSTYANYKCRCEPCRDAWRAYKAKAKAARKADGVCVDCGAPADTYRVRCRFCAERYNARSRAARDRRAAKLAEGQPHNPTIHNVHVQLPRRGVPGKILRIEDTGIPSLPPGGFRRRRSRAEILGALPGAPAPGSAWAVGQAAGGWTPPPDAAPGVNQPFHEGPPPLMHADGAAEVGDDMLKALQARDYFNEEPTAATHTPSEADPTSPYFLPIGPNGKRVTKEGYARFKQRIADGQAELARRAAAEEAAEKAATGGAAADAGTGDETEG